MAVRPYFKVSEEGERAFQEKNCDFKYYSGFALSQKQKSIFEMHKAINSLEPSGKILEISTKSDNPLGVRLSAFNLMFFDQTSQKEYFIENIFQSSKLFEDGGPYLELLDVHPRIAKRDDRLKTSGNLVGFKYKNDIWPLEPKTMFYDWIYMKALSRNEELRKLIVEYNIFTDIEFNPKKSVNCQARAAAIFVFLERHNILDETLNSYKQHIEIY